MASASAAAVDLAAVDAAYQAKRWDEAAQGYADAVEADDSNAQAWFRLGIARWQLGERDAANAAFDRAVGIGVPRNMVDFQVATMSAGAGEHAAALDALERAAEGGYSGAAGPQADEFAPLRADARYAAAAQRIQFNSAPCEATPEFRQFDFWVGQWDVVNASDVPQGTNRIEKEERGCVLSEHWTGVGGSTGQSLNHYDPVTGKWHQRWISNGFIAEIEGGLNNGAMVLSGRGFYIAQGRETAFRGTWTPLEDGRVRQYFEESDDGGETWQPWFEGFYRRAAQEQTSKNP